MTDNELKELNEQVNEFGFGPNRIAILVALIKARAIENAGNKIAEALDYIARNSTGA